ncbi:tyrosyl-trna synthetase [Hordeum vulgare]|nr:tyrosyl-trna synthetase [Hordeum vulgare]
MDMTTESLMEHALETSDKVARKDDASIFGGESDDVPSSTFIHEYGDDMVEHWIFPSTTAVFGVELRNFRHHIESESDFTTSPIYDELPQFPFEESHNPHHLSEMSDSTIHGDTLESAYLELDDDECLLFVHFYMATPSPSHGDLDFDPRMDLSQGGGDDMKHPKDIAMARVPLPSDTCYIYFKYSKVLSELQG